MKELKSSETKRWFVRFTRSFCSNKCESSLSSHRTCFWELVFFQHPEFLTILNSYWIISA